MKNYDIFEPTPFYFLNDTFDKKEIDFQLDVMRKSGIKSFFLHVRDGILDQAYGTSLFFENIRYIVEEAKKKDLKVWLYDEDSFPSGNAGGLIAIENPELQAYSLKVDKIKPEEIENGIARKVLGKVKGLYGYRVKTNGQKEESEKIQDCFGAVRRYWYRRDMDKTYYCDMQNKLFYPHVRAGTSYAEIMFEAKVDDDSDTYVAYLEPVFTDSHYGLQADCLNKKTTEQFIARTHEQYAKYVGEYFGTVIPGIFMDEPAAGGVLPFTDELTERFKQKRNYDVTDYFYKLSSNYTGDGKTVRRHYIETVTDLFCDNFIKPIAEWCERHGLLATGHFYGEEDPLSSALCAQSVYRQTKLMGIPGCDIIGRYLGDTEHCALVLGTKIVVSSAQQSDKKRILAECFAINPFNFGYEGLRKTGDWLFACGINWLAPHALFYGYGAYQRCDAGKSFFYQDRLFSEYLEFSRYAGRVCKLLNDYKHKSDVLMVLPNGSFNEEVPFPMMNTGVYPSDRALKIQNLCYDVVRYMISNQVAWDVADVDSVGNAAVKNGKVGIGSGEYAKVIFIDGGETDRTAYEKIKSENVDCVLFDGTSYDGFPNGYGLKGNNKDIILYKKYGKDGDLIFLYQNCRKFAEIELPVKGDLWVYDAEKDESYKVETENGVAKLGLRGYDSLILTEGNPAAATTDKTYSYTVCGDRTLECEENPQWTYMPPNAEFAVTRYDITVKGEIVDEEFKDHKYAPVRELIGTQDKIYSSNYVIPYFDTAKRPKDMYPCKVEYVSKINDVDGCEHILFDGGTLTGDYKIFWNDAEINKNEIIKTHIYDAKNYIFKPEWKKGCNIMKIVFEQANEFDGINGEIYVLRHKENTL